MNKERAPQSEAFQDEKNAWRKVLGVEVDIQPLPVSITPEVTKNLKEMGMELRFIPALNLGTLEDLNKQGEESYLKNLQLHYPNWKRYESIGDEWKDHSITRNLGEWYWAEVKDVKIDFPQFPGTWMAVEMMPKPDSLIDHHYAPSKISEKLGFKTRFHITCNEANEAITREKNNILNDAGLYSGDVRMLEAIEWNLLGNREGWGKTTTYEWTNTEFRSSGNLYRVILGNSHGGGVAGGGRFYPSYGDRNIGFRVAIVFTPPLQLVVKEIFPIDLEKC